LPVAASAPATTAPCASLFPVLEEIPLPLPKEEERRIRLVEEESTEKNEENEENATVKEIDGEQTIEDEGMKEEVEEERRVIERDEESLAAEDTSGQEKASGEVREMENISRGPTFGDFVTICTEASMQGITVARLQSTRVQTPLYPFF
jgi:hypothetical protein